MSVTMIFWKHNYESIDNNGATNETTAAVALLSQIVTWTMIKLFYEKDTMVEVLIKYRMYEKFQVRSENLIVTYGQHWTVLALFTTIWH